MGAFVLLSAVGAGSAGIYYGRPLLSAAMQGETAPPAEATAVATADSEPTPIPLPVASETVPVASSNPFARSTQPAPEHAADRYSNPIASDALPPPGEIPDASALAAPATEGIATAGRFAVQQASAEEAAESEPTVAGAEEPIEEGSAHEALDEPRRLTHSGEEEGVDRYGRPLATRDNPMRRPTALEPEIEEEPVAEPESDSELEPEEQAPPADEMPGEAEVDEPAEGVAGTGRPGDPQLSGSQAPTLTIEKTAPPEIQIGKPAKFTIKVRNTGKVTAHGVEIHDSVPQGTQLIETIPTAESGADGELVWDLGTLKPNEEQMIELQLMPMTEGEIGSVATVHFRAEASVRTMATKPLLTMEVFAPSKVMKGEEVTFKIKLANPGSGATSGVVLSETVPEGLKHSAGNELEFEVGTLKPGESRELELGLIADAAGDVTNVIMAQADANLEVEVRTELEVIAPQLKVSLSGPKRRYLERNATHQISVMNPGTAAAKEIELAASLPRELKFIEANNGGQYDAATHSVYWSLEELPPQEMGTVVLTTLPQQPGEAKLTIKSTAQDGLQDQREEVLSIEGLAAINFQLSDAKDPVEAGGETSYEVRVTNQGTKAATGLRVVAILPAEMQAISAEGPVRYKIEGQRIVFDPLKQLAPKADTAFTVKVKTLAPGDLRLQVQIVTDEIQEPITKEESTRVFGDE
jgi:uncharacterized repeat protein (TIGR01451 family)